MTYDHLTSLLSAFWSAFYNQIGVIGCQICGATVHTKDKADVIVTANHCCSYIVHSVYNNKITRGGAAGVIITSSNTCQGPIDRLWVIKSRFYVIFQADVIDDHVESFSKEMEFFLKVRYTK